VAGLVAVGFKDGHIDLYDRHGAIENRTPVGLGTPALLRLSDDGREVAAFIDPDEMVVYDRLTGRTVVHLEHGAFGGNFEPGDSTMLVSSLTGIVRRIDLRSGRQVGPDLPVRAGSTIDDPRSYHDHIVVPAAGSQAQVLDKATDVALGKPFLLGVAQSAVMTNDDKYLFLPGDYGIERWDMRTSRWRTAACELAGRDITRDEWAHYVGGVLPYHSVCRSPPR
jgi:hypothetical protein